MVLVTGIVQNTHYCYITCLQNSRADLIILFLYKMHCIPETLFIILSAIEKNSVIC